MTLEQDALYRRVVMDYESFRSEAKKHRSLHRGLWLVSTSISLAIAVTANFDFPVFRFGSEDVSAVLALLLPAVTAYLVLRSPERLWILETVTRNRLADLKTRIELGFARDEHFDSSGLDEEWLQIRADSGEEWEKLKLGAG